MGLIPVILAIQNMQSVVIPEIPFDDTIIFSEDIIVNNNPDYSAFGNYIQNPINKKTLQLYRVAPNHIMDTSSKVCGKITTDDGKTFGSQFDIYDPAIVGVNEPGVGYDSSGRLHLFASVRDNADLSLMTIDELRYLYSDDDGVTISTPIAITYPSDGLLHSWTTGRMIENNGVLLKNYYRITIGGATSANYLLRSTDYGATWNTITIRSVGATYINEADIIALDDSNLLTIIRNETIGGWQQYRSDDNGLTWSEDGNITFSETLGSVRKPPSLRSFNINNTRVIAFYSFNDNTNKHFVVYAKASDLISGGLSGWNISTKLILNTTNTSLGYNNEVHINNTLQAIMVTYEDYSLSYTKTYYYTLPTTHYNTLKTSLGI